MALLSLFWVLFNEKCKEMKTMHRLSYSFSKIKEMQVFAETEKTVTTDEGMEYRISEYHRWFNTYEEAHRALTEHAHARIIAAAEAQRQAQAFAEKVAALAPEKPSNA